MPRAAMSVHTNTLKGSSLLTLTTLRARSLVLHSLEQHVALGTGDVSIKHSHCGRRQGAAQGFRELVRSFQAPNKHQTWACLLYTSPSPRDRTRSRMPSSA
eukprot:TRINITY_DN6920_c0_g1_i2.p1 TRINITY_DN6920_c0_g1~~TRINITY_DN6920_c0_g1_i2.p1  ORF type:complete len:101 (-),score=26.76 TRINITY_DN6920_c0_g1_i2:55-357(-)